MSQPNKIGRTLRYWHARIGIVAALFFLLLVATGIALNHTEALQLDTKRVSASWLTNWYGLRSSAPHLGFQVGEKLLIGNDERWVWGGQVLAEQQAQPLGAAATQQFVWVANAGALYMYLPDAKLVEKISGSALPGQPIQRLGSAGDEVVIGTAAGNFASQDAAQWSAPSAPVQWATARPLSAQEQLNLSALFAPSVSLERVLLDLHSGRLFGAYGPLLVDAAAIALSVLALSGLWIYVRGPRR